MPDASSDEYPPEQLELYAEITRTLFERENARQHERLQWLLQLQSFLYAALAFGWDKGPLLMLILGGVGLVSAFSLGMALVDSVRAMDAKKREWDRRGRAYGGPPIVARWVELTTLRQLRHPVVMLPALFVVSWVVLLQATVRRG